jgi:hypothetical protein
MSDTDSGVLCQSCNLRRINPHRFDIGYTTCMPCGEKAAKKRKHTIVPVHKSGYIVVSKESKELLTQLNRPGRGSDY